jgi:hypothetical protein
VSRRLLALPLLAAGTVAAAGALALAPGPAPARSECHGPISAPQIVTFSRAKYPSIYQHWLDATAKGWPNILVLDRSGADTRRDKLLAPMPMRAGMDRDEYPPATAREGWLADVEYVPSRENRSQGASLGAQLRGLCDGQRLQYHWSP